LSGNDGFTQHVATAWVSFSRVPPVLSISIFAFPETLKVNRDVVAGSVNSSGMVPDKSLFCSNKCFNVGMLNSTDGNVPVKRLFQTSKTSRDVIWAISEGRVPVNLVPYKPSDCRSFSNPTSLGIYAQFCG